MFSIILGPCFKEQFYCCCFSKPLGVKCVTKLHCTLKKDEAFNDFFFRQLTSKRCCKGLDWSFSS